MNRGNVVLLVALAVAVGFWLLGRDWQGDKSTQAASRLFPEFNREGADRIEISGGPSETAWTIAKAPGGDWVLASAGGYPVKRAEVDRFLDAVWNLRKDNPVGGSAELRERTQTDDSGRLVRVLKDGQPMAEFHIGKNPERGYSEFFVRKEGDDAIYRTHTLLTEDRERAMDETQARAAPGFDWHSYTDELSRKWIDSTIWDLGGAEVEEIWLTRRDLYDAKVVKQAQDKWELMEEGKEPVPADADVADGILSVLRRLSLYEVLGTYDQVAKEYGLDAPDITLVMKLRKKVPAPPPKEGEEEKEGEEKKDEYKTFHRTVEVGKKVERKRYDSYSDEIKSDDYYAVHVGPAKDMEDPQEAKRAGYVFLVRDYTASQLRKDLKDLQAKEAEGHGEEEEGAKPGDEEKPGDEKKPADETKPTDEKKPADEATPTDETKPTDEEKPADEKEEPKEGCGEEPKDEGCGCG